ncbi:high mobility group protein B1-like [Tupaia chinensis]|uniref:high mobility group protein B1-like n=1 Tax=Tupaia chinensis TaxID=246437 RepID=UPI000FFB622D|nr:high mobility group protein B1-like [Tupaia chinensis]
MRLYDTEDELWYRLWTLALTWCQRRLIDCDEKTTLVRGSGQHERGEDRDARRTRTLTVTHRRVTLWSAKDCIYDGGLTRPWRAVLYSTRVVRYTIGVCEKFKDPNAPKRPPSAFFLFCSEYRPKIKEHPGLSIGDIAKKLGELWTSTAADGTQPRKKAAKLEEKHGKAIAAYRAEGKPDAAKKAVVKAEKSKKKEEEEDEEDEEDEEEEEDEENDDEQVGSSAVFFLVYKAFNCPVHK